MDDVLHAVHEHRALAADVEQALDAQDVARRGSGGASSARRRTHSSRAARRGRDSDGAHVAVRRGRRSSGRGLGPVPPAPKSTDGSISPNDASTTAAVGFSRSSSERTSAPSLRSVFVTTSVSAAAACLTDSGSRQAVLCVHRRDHALEPEVVLHDGLREQRVEDRRRGRPCRSSRPTTRRKAGISPRSRRREQVAQLVGEIAAQRAADAPVLRAAPCARPRAAAGGGRSPTSPSSLTITAVSPISG